jgi:hypothetical protein
MYSILWCVREGALTLALSQRERGLTVLFVRDMPT